MRERKKEVPDGVQGPVGRGGAKERSGLCDDEIKRLEHELGRCRKKVADDGKEIERLRKLLEQANKGNRETQTMVDAILTAVALHCGETVCLAADDESKKTGAPGETEGFVGERKGSEGSGACPLGRDGGCEACPDAGKRLNLPRFNALEMRTRYEIHARKEGETGGYVIGVMERDGFADLAGAGGHGEEGAT